MSFNNGSKSSRRRIAGLVLAIFAACAARHHLFAATLPEPLALGDKTGGVQLVLYTVPSVNAARALNTFDVQAFGESLLGGPARGALSNVWDNVLINGRGVDLEAINSLPVLQRASGAEWEYAAVDVTPAYTNRLTRFHRHLLFVQPDLFVICDELTAKEPAEVQFRLPSSVQPQVDVRWGSLGVAQPKAGLTVHCLMPGRRVPPPWKVWDASGDPGSAVSKRWLAQTGPTNKVAELRLLTVLVPHRAGQERSLAYKILESQNAIGARLYRDGLPTLVAFRTEAAPGEVSLGGLNFTGPVAVDVFHPKRKP